MLNSPARLVRDSLGSNPPLSPAAILDSGSPPAPRETILDRAFQMKYIPGSEQQIPGEEKLSSLARFEALMQQMDAQRRKQSLRPLSVAQQMELKSAWDLDDDSDEEDSDAESHADTEGELALEQDTEEDDVRSSIRPESRRVPPPSPPPPPPPPVGTETEAEAETGTGTRRQQGPHTPQQSPRGTAGPRSPIAFNPETLAALSSGPERPRFAQRMHAHTLSGLGNMSLGPSSQPPQSHLEASPGKSSIMSIETTASGELVGGGGGLNPTSAYRTSTIAEGQQRHSTTSSSGGKRLSFSEFSRRLSSASSMLLVQTGTPYGNEQGDSQGQSRRSSLGRPFRRDFPQFL